MSAYNQAVPASAPRTASYPPSIPIVDSAAPVGTFAPGTKIQVGSQKVVIQKYFSEGGFAHVYLVKMPQPIDGTDIAVLKRVAVPDKENLANMRTEVETMKKLKGHRPIVTYYDSHASQLKGGGYEVFLLMEFCNGGGLIDFMNTRLQNRLTEPEILKIFSDVSEGVACMHYLQPPLLHRDLKVENVLITSTKSGKRFKLCDFGSTAPPRPAATTPAEGRLIEEDVQKHTTLQYRSPEMIDVYRKQPIDEKSDIWALGVLLYKLCYYTTPFEAQGQLAILNASFKFPAYPPFSDPLKHLIASMLKEKPSSRPNIYQVLREACLMQGLEVPIKDIYSGRTHSEARRNEKLPSPVNAATPPMVGAVFVQPQQQVQVIPDVVPMRRGRPAASPNLSATKPAATKRPSPSPMRVSDPFAALDSTSPPTTDDDISNRFPSLDQFSLLHDGSKFDFDSSSPTIPPKSKDLSQRVTETLADNAFARPASSKSPAIGSMDSIRTSSTPIVQNSSFSSKDYQNPPIPVNQPIAQQPRSSGYVSQGTMTSPSPPPGDLPSFRASPRFPPVSDHHRSASVPRAQDMAAMNRSQLLRPEENQSLHPAPSQSPLLRPTHMRHPSSSRPSLEGGRPSNEVLEPMARTRSTNARSRPTSTYLESSVDYLREKESRPSLNMERQPSWSGKETPLTASPPDDPNIESNMNFLRQMENNDDKSKDKDRRRSGGSNKSKRTSLPSMSLSGTKNLLAGKFGDAFKRFENNTSALPRTPSPLHELERRDLTPIAGSEATDDRSDDGDATDTENLGPEQRRELERRRLSLEEKRVADAAAEYRQRLAERGTGPAPRSIGGISRATTIQNKVKNLLDESQQSPQRKTVEGYGRFTDNMSPQAPLRSVQQPTNPYPKPNVARKPVPGVNSAHVRPLPAQAAMDFSKPLPQAPLQTNIASSLPSKPIGGRPNVPPKSNRLNSIATGNAQSVPLGAPMGAPLQHTTSLPTRTHPQAHPNMTVQEREDYIADFSKRFPSLSGIEMVETQIEKKYDDVPYALPRREDRAPRTKDV